MSYRLIVTGGCGFIGSNFIRHVLAARPGWHVTNLDCLSYAGNLDNLRDVQSHRRYRLVVGDIRNGQLVSTLFKTADAVINFAAESHVDRSIESASAFVDTNVRGTQVLLDAARCKRGIRYLQVSTDEVYGSLPLDRPDLLFTEESPIAPNNPYAASKAAADCLVRSYHHTFGLDAVITRCSNNFGPYQFPEKVIPLFITNLMDGKKVPLYGDGRNVRDWLHVEDHCTALATVLERGTAGEVYNIGGGNERSNLELTRCLLDALGRDERSIEHVADRLGHDRRYAIDSTKMMKTFGWTARHSAWPDAMARTVAWYVANERWWRRVKLGAHHRQQQASLFA